MYAEQHLRCYEHHVLVEEKLHQDADAQVIPVPVHQQRFSQILELREGEVGGYRGLTTLFPQYSDTNVRLLYHRDVVTPVTDRRGMRTASRRFYQMHNLRR